MSLLDGGGNDTMTTVAEQVGLVTCAVPTSYIGGGWGSRRKVGNDASGYPGDRRGPRVDRSRKGEMTGQGTAPGELVVQTWRDVLRAVAFLRAASRSIDQLLGEPGSSAHHGQLEVALIQTSLSAQRALVMLTEARELLADLIFEVTRQPPQLEDAAKRDVHRGKKS